jgi:hypothetical protein
MPVPDFYVVARVVGRPGAFKPVSLAVTHHLLDMHVT